MGSGHWECAVCLSACLGVCFTALVIGWCQWIHINSHPSPSPFLLATKGNHWRAATVLQISKLSAHGTVAFLQSTQGQITTLNVGHFAQIRWEIFWVAVRKTLQRALDLWGGHLMCSFLPLTFPALLLWRWGDWGIACVCPVIAAARSIGWAAGEKNVQPLDLNQIDHILGRRSALSVVIHCNGPTLPFLLCFYQDIFFFSTVCQIYKIIPFTSN